MLDVIKSQLAAAEASIVAARALIETLQPAPIAQAQEDAAREGECAHPMHGRLAIAGRPGAWVCDYCQHNEVGSNG